MADRITLSIHGDSPEAVAYALFLGVAASENKRVINDIVVDADRKWILDTYLECLAMVRSLNGQASP